MKCHCISNTQVVWERDGKLSSPDDSPIKQGEDEVESDGAPGNKVIHPRPEVGLQGQLSTE